MNSQFKARKKVVAEQMEVNGWTTVDSVSFGCTSAVASKKYRTAVGLKQAIAHLNPADSSELRLVADYQSEGRNILSTTTLLIPDGIEDSSVHAGLNQFCNAVDAAVAESYAARLHNGGRGCP